MKPHQGSCVTAWAMSWHKGCERMGDWCPSMAPASGSRHGVAIDCDSPTLRSHSCSQKGKLMLDTISDFGQLLLKLHHWIMVVFLEAGHVRLLNLTEHNFEASQRPGTWVTVIWSGKGCVQLAKPVTCTRPGAISSMRSTPSSMERRNRIIYWFHLSCLCRWPTFFLFIWRWNAPIIFISIDCIQTTNRHGQEISTA